MITWNNVIRGLSNEGYSELFNQGTNTEMPFSTANEIAEATYIWGTEVAFCCPDEDEIEYSILYFPSKDIFAYNVGTTTTVPTTNEVWERIRHLWSLAWEERRQRQEEEERWEEEEKYQREQELEWLDRNSS